MQDPSTRNEIKQKLKLWEREFADTHGRSPQKRDLDREPHIRALYKDYARLKRDLENGPATPAKGHDIPAQLGPTPQVNGRAVSIFEVMSPLSDPVVAPSHHTLQACGLGSQETRLPAQKYGPNSPLRLPVSTPFKHGPQTLARGPSNSPSPLFKIPGRSLIELAKEHEKLAHEFKPQQQQASSSPPVAEPQNPTDQQLFKPKKRKLLQRLQEDEAAHAPLPKDLHKELQRLKQNQVNEYFDKDPVARDDVPQESQITTQPQPTQKRKKKYNLVSNNFKRLKINKRKPRFKR